MAQKYYRVTIQTGKELRRGKSLTVFDEDSFDVVVHPDYHNDKNGYFNDIAIIKLHEEVLFGKLQSVCCSGF